MLRKISLLGVFVLGFCGMTMQARAQVPRTWHDADLTALAGGPLVPGLVFGCIALIDDAVHHVIRSNYLATDLMVHELYLQE